VSAVLRFAITMRPKLRIELDLREPCIVNRAEYSGEIRLCLPAQHKLLWAKGHSHDVGEGVATCAKNATRSRCGEKCLEESSPGLVDCVCNSHGLPVFCRCGVFSGKR
jgi:hypothetical protein